MSEGGDAELEKIIGADTKEFELLSKHYYDLFAYHAAQRLTTFNFFIVSLSFFSNAYATLMAKADSDHPSFYIMAAVLSFTAYALVVLFSRLDKRNEQIIVINEGPLKRIQAAVAKRFGGDDWETFKRSNEEARPLRTFGRLLPLIYLFAGPLAATGASYGLLLGGIVDQCSAVWIGLTLMAISLFAITVAGPRRGPESANPSKSGTGGQTGSGGANGPQA